ncbi:MAG TPA: hypothetical protein VLH36_01805 [Steroidobacteraceae bacterium]|jgi:hypothetical protein|nr:hypothetical protein [Steroidobacteraceae bacterium]
MATSTRRYKDGFHEQVARLGKAVAAQEFTAHRMEQGVPDWRARGWRVETAAARTPARQRPRAAR